MKKLFSILLFICYLYPAAFAQNHATERPGATKKIGTVVTAIVVDGDTIPVVNLRMFRVIGHRKFKSEAKRRRFNRLKRDVKIVYPYAKLAGKKLRKYNDELAGIKNEGKRKRFMRKVEKELKEEFGDELKNLTIRQGAILIRLVDRETGDTSYELVKELRGTFSAFFWQGLARIFGQNLRNHYDPSGDQKMIEEIVLLIESGDL